MAWTMVTQTPPILIQVMHKRNEYIRFDPRHHEAYRDGTSTTAAHHVYIKSILWPAMYESDSKRIIAKGEVEV